MKRFILFLTLLSAFSIGAQVGKFNLLDSPEKINGGELELPEGVVAMSEFVKISNSSETLEKGGASSIFFVIDNSRSMFTYMQKSTHTGPFDLEGARYKATLDIIDSIYAKSPDTEIGLSVFSAYLYFDPTDDELFEEIVTYKDKYTIEGGFIPLLKLNEPVKKGKYKGELGYDVLKRYLETKEYEYEFEGHNNIHQNLAYKPSNKKLHPTEVYDVGLKTGTNIWAGFSAAKEAMLNATQPKSDQYIIFFSDGANQVNNDDEGPSKSEDWREVVIPNCPTSFTVFFNPASSNTTKHLEEFTKGASSEIFLKGSVQGNGYSSSNPKSDLWAITAGREKLVDTLMINVVADIIKTTTKVIPTKIKIQGIDAGNWDGTGFTFTNLFPLTGVTTPVNYTIDYDIIRDSITETGDTVVVETKSETIVIDYDAILKNSPTPSLEYELLWWDRTLAGFDSDTAIVTVESAKGELEIRFDEKAIDTLYDYPNVEITITTGNGDEEKVTLDKNGSSFRKKVQRTIGTAAKNDGVVQYNPEDKITLSYANPNLPLDTISTTIPVDASMGFTVSDVIYHDSRGDGQVDQIFVKISGDSLVDQLTELGSKIAFPSERDFNITAVAIQNDGIRLTVDERGPVTTAVHSYDMAKMNDTLTLSDLSLVVPFELKIRDSIAPVLLEASLVDSIKAGAEDLLTVKYSEDIEDIFAASPLTFFDNGSNASGADLEKRSFNGTEATFLVLNNLSLADKEFVNISLNSPACKDRAGIEQKNDQNVKVPLKVTTVADGLQISRAENLDNDGNGKIDQILLTLNQSIEGADLSQLPGKLQLDSRRNYTPFTAALLNGKISLTLKEESADIFTGLFDGESVTLTEDVVLTDTTTLRANSVPVTDMVAPVATEAILADSVKVGSEDYLTVTFSEDMSDQFIEKPFTFFGGETAVSMKKVSGSGNSAKFLITDNSFVPTDYDSLNITADENGASDAAGNVQKIKENHKVELQLIRIAEELAVTELFYRDSDGDGLMNALVIRLNRSLDKGDASELKNRITLPSERKLTGENVSFSGNEITLTLKDESDGINTGLFSGESLELTANLELSDTATIPAGKISFSDSVAPVIISAEYRNYDSSDSLFINFSENMEKAGGEKPFILVDQNGENPYELSLADADINGSSVKYRVTDGEANYRDSISIAPNRGVEDEAGNEQKIDNRRVELNYYRIVAREIETAVYFDESDPADGYVDRIRLSFDGEIHESLLEEIRKKIALPENRFFTIEELSLESETVLNLKVSQDKQRAGAAKTFCEDSDTIAVTESIEMQKDTLLFTLRPSSAKADDSLAPVIISAIYLPMEAVDDGELIDTFAVTFSEEIESLNEGTRFNFFDLSDNSENGITTGKGNSGRTVRYTTVAGEKLPAPEGNDSLSVIAMREVKDLNGTEQKVNTVRVPLKVAPYRYSFDITVFPNPFDLSEEDYENPVIKTYSDGTMPLNAVAIMVKPKGNRRLLGDIDASMVVVDNAGNQIYASEDGAFQYQESSGVLLNAIEAKNKNGRDLGSGAYLGMIRVELRGESTETVEEKVMIGVKK